MYEATRWRVRQSVTLFTVAVLHAGLLAMLLVTTRAGHSAAVEIPIEISFIPPVALPKILANNPRPQRLSGVLAISVAPPMLESSSQWTPSSGSEGNGSGVDWKAEARRAVQAFEIRRHELPRNTSVSGSPAEDILWPRQTHHAGEQFKLANGDWIVWINSNCYQAAGAATNGSVLTQLHHTVCVDTPDPPRRDTPDRSAADEKAHARHP